MTDAPGPDPAAPTALTIEPVVSWPHEVRAGGLYQLTVDVRPAADAGAWPFPREEVTVHLQLFCPPGIVPTLMTEPAVVLHRFGGTYGPARYVLAVDDAVRSGSLQLVLSNRAGVPFHVAGLAFRAVPQVRPEPEAPAPREPPVTTVHVTRTVAGDPGLPAAPAHGTDDLSGRQDISPHEDVHADDRPHLETLGFCRPDGSRVVWEVEMMPGPAVRTRNFRTRYGRYQNFPLAIRYAVGGESAEFALENAVGAGLRMLRFFDADRRWPWEGNPQRYPWELSRLVGYDVECDVPFAITVEFGMPLAGLRSSGTAGSLSSPDDLRAFTVGLARGLAVLDRLGVVHRQIRENTVHWDARSRVVQINRFEYARRGSARCGTGRRRSRSPVVVSSIRGMTCSARAARFSA
ncbi:hypothetical protein FRACA_830012 [Frankia canadensis]|uniref:Protein kinase domain-containing protein n=1 Tax=Frankia canadensis TaxID=1836972 RepID=A0A2I2L1R3_9ACTN|nr:hypothetical protein [Frankia canadensis]SNQ51849.1 hypothetical protein FRACA_830012 [Frankia canadensis]SOU59139.1 hypothetical protein FRACA_830012 [Frankia canadensis]